MMGIKERNLVPLPRDLSLEELVPEDNFYRRLQSTLDLSFARELVHPFYVNAGRPSVDPVVFFTPHARVALQEPLPMALAATLSHRRCCLRHCRDKRRDPSDTPRVPLPATHVRLRPAVRRARREDGSGVVSMRSISKRCAATVTPSPTAKH